MFATKLEQLQPLCTGIFSFTSKAIYQKSYVCRQITYFGNRYARLQYIYSCVHSGLNVIELAHSCHRLRKERTFFQLQGPDQTFFGFSLEHLRLEVTSNTYRFRNSEQFQRGSGDETQRPFRSDEQISQVVSCSSLPA